MRRISLIVLVLTCSTWLAARTASPQDPHRPEGQRPHGETATGQGAASAQAPPTFRSGVALVQMDVTVLDEDRRPVTGLTAADFIVKEDGVERPIAAFTPVDLSGGSAAVNAAGTPAAATLPVAAAPTAAAATARSDGSEPGRLVAILMDRSTPPGEPTLVAKHIANAVVDALGPRDQAAVLYTGFGTPQEFTRDRALLHAAIAKSDPSAVLSDDVMAMREFQDVDPLQTGSCYCGLCVPETIAHVAETVQAAPQRKVLFFVGHDMEFQSARDDCGFLLRKARDRMVRAIDVANLTVHVIDPSGLANPLPSAQASCCNTPFHRDMAQKEAAKIADENRRRATLMTIPGYTGGRTVLSTNTPWAAVPGIFAESAAYYVLAIQPGHPAADGSYHRLEVKVKRRGVQVRAREGYYARK
jgi:VWFA-related protein